QKSLILFDFGREIYTQFHMNNVPAALDIAFVKDDGRVFAILRMDPSPTALYGPLGNFRYALEARAGFYEGQGIRQGEARLLPPAPEKTYGYYRVEILAALLNGVVLCVLALVILFEAWERLRRPHEVLAGPVLVVAVAALGVNLFAARLLHAGAVESLNVRSAYLEVLGDALSSAAVIAAAGVILLTGWTTADALASAAIGLLILPRTAS